MGNTLGRALEEDTREPDHRPAPANCWACMSHQLTRTPWHQSLTPLTQFAFSLRCHAITADLSDDPLRAPHTIEREAIDAWIAKRSDIDNEVAAYHVAFHRLLKAYDPTGLRAQTVYPEHLLDPWAELRARPDELEMG